MESNSQSKDQKKSNSEVNAYTPGETKFADGEGSTLDKQTEARENENDRMQGDSKKENSSKEKATFENPDDDPA